MSILCVNIYAQNRSSYPAAFFKSDGQEAPIEVGKGLNITDPFTPTRPCFTSASRDGSLLKKQGSGGAETKVEVFYTKDEYQYNMFKSSNMSGNVSFLNMASLSTSALEKMTSSKNKVSEKLIFVCTIDFGNYYYPDDPIFTTDAQSLLDAGKYDDFKKRYGTHFVSGIGKGASVTVELSLNEEESEDMSSFDFDLDASLHYKADLNFSMTNQSELNQKFSSRGFSAKLFLNGPQLSDDWEEVIKSKTKEDDLIESVSTYLKNQVKDMKEENAVPLRYFLTDFTLYGCEGIKWNLAKEKKLSSINKNYLDCYNIINLAQENIDINPIDNPKSILNIIPYFSEQNNNYPYDQLKKQVASVNPEWTKLIASANAVIEKLQNQYDNCSDITCAINESCCGKTDYTNEVKQLFAQYDIIYNKIDGYASQWLDNVMEQEHQRVKKAKFTVINKSSNPYNIYINGKFKKELSGGYKTTWTVNLGKYEIKAVQKSGYLFDATVNHRTVNLTQEGQEVSVTIGYED